MITKITNKKNKKRIWTPWRMSLDPDLEREEGEKKGTEGGKLRQFL